MLFGPSSCVLRIRPLVRAPAISYIPNNPAPRFLQKAAHRIAALYSMPNRTTPAEETSPLLGHQRPESYQTNGDTSTVNDKVVPRLSLVWILAALWSAVFLSALDGTLSNGYNWTQLHSRNHRNRCRNITLSYRCTLQSIESIVLHRDFVFAVCMLLHAIVRETIRHSWT